MNHDCTTKAVGDRGQIEVVAGPLSPDQGRLVAADNG